MKKLVTFEGEEYCNAGEVARLLGISRATFYNNAKPLLTPCNLPARKVTHYKISEIKKKFGLSVVVARKSA